MLQAPAVKQSQAVVSSRAVAELAPRQMLPLALACIVTAMNWLRRSAAKRASAQKLATWSAAPRMAERWRDSMNEGTKSARRPLPLLEWGD